MSCGLAYTQLNNPASVIAMGQLYTNIPTLHIKRKKENLIQVWSIADRYTFSRRCGLAYIQLKIPASVSAMGQLYTNIIRLPNNMFFWSNYKMN